MGEVLAGRVCDLVLCRVPSRLPSDLELRQRAAEEDEAVSSIVEEVRVTGGSSVVLLMLSVKSVVQVLASSPELAGEQDRLRPPH